LRPIAIPSEQVRRSGWIPWAFAGAFLVVVGANVTLAVEASRSWTGVVTETPFDTGNDYNRVIAQTEREASFGWRINAEAVRISGDRVRIAVVVGGDSAAPIADLDGTLFRPIGLNAPVPIQLRAVSPGRFEAELKLPDAGNWDLHLVIRSGERQLHTTRRLFVS
jgi:nitrogen fixation protein FixH